MNATEPEPMKSPPDSELPAAAVAEFTGHNVRLKSLETRLAEIEAKAPGDVHYAYRIQRRDRRHWPRIVAQMEELAGMRLEFAVLEPRLANPDRKLGKDMRKAAERLAKAADVPYRLESFGNRLEALEDLYEGASDRINDYRMYRDGHLLEIGIIALLVIEVILMSGEIYLSYLNYITRLDTAN